MPLVLDKDSVGVMLGGGVISAGSVLETKFAMFNRLVRFDCWTALGLEVLWGFEFILGRLMVLMVGLEG